MWRSSALNSMPSNGRGTPSTSTMLRQVQVAMAFANEALRAALASISGARRSNSRSSPARSAAMRAPQVVRGRRWRQRIEVSSTQRSAVAGCRSRAATAGGASGNRPPARQRVDVRRGQRPRAPCWRAIGPRRSGACAAPSRWPAARRRPPRRGAARRACRRQAARRDRAAARCGGSAAAPRRSRRGAAPAVEKSRKGRRSGLRSL